MLSKKDYIKIADILKANYKYSGSDRVTLNRLLADLVKYFEKDNSKFNTTTFLNYIYGGG